MIKTYTKDTLTREVLERGVKLRVIDEQHSAAFQAACLSLGAVWVSSLGRINHTELPYLFVENFGGSLCFSYSTVECFFDNDSCIEIHFDDGRHGPSAESPSITTDMKLRYAYIIDFSKQGCIETVIDDGRPAFQRLRGLGVLFDSKQDAQRWLDNHIEGEKMVNLTREKELHEWLMEWFSRGRCIAWDEGPCHPLCSRCAEEKYFRSWCKDNGVKVTID